MQWFSTKHFSFSSKNSFDKLILIEEKTKNKSISKLNLNLRIWFPTN